MEVIGLSLVWGWGNGYTKRLIGCPVQRGCYVYVNVKSRDQTFFMYYLYKYFGNTEIEYTTAYTTCLQNKSTAIFLHLCTP